MNFVFDTRNSIRHLSALSTLWLNTVFLPVVSFLNCIYIFVADLAFPTLLHIWRMSDYFCFQCFQNQLSWSKFQRFVMPFFFFRPQLFKPWFTISYEITSPNVRVAKILSFLNVQWPEISWKAVSKRCSWQPPAPPGQFHTSLTFCFEHTVMDFHCTACHTRKHNFIPNSSSADTALDTKSSGWRLLCNELHFFFLLCTQFSALIEPYGLIWITKYWYLLTAIRLVLTYLLLSRFVLN